MITTEATVSRLPQDSQYPPQAFQNIPIGLVDPHPDNPRDDWEAQDIEGLVPSITRRGILQPIVVRPVGQRFQLIAGERRLRAAKLAKRKTIPAIVRDVSDEDALTDMLIENLNRKGLNPLQKARAIHKLCAPIAEGGRGMKHSEVAALFGKTREWAANLVRLLKLPKPWQAKIAAGKMSERQARALVSHAESPELLKRIEQDMEANPWAWKSTDDFERQLGILAANPKAKLGIVPAPTRAARAPSADRAQNGEAAAAPAPRAASERVEVPELCALIARATMQDLDKLQAAINKRRAAINAA